MATWHRQRRRKFHPARSGKTLSAIAAPFESVERIYVTGTTALDETATIVGENDAYAQTVQVDSQH